MNLLRKLESDFIRNNDNYIKIGFTYSIQENQHQYPSTFEKINKFLKRPVTKKQLKSIGRPNQKSIIKEPISPSKRILKHESAKCAKKIECSSNINENVALNDVGFQVKSPVKKENNQTKNNNDFVKTNSKFAESNNNSLKIKDNFAESNITFVKSNNDFAENYKNVQNNASVLSDTDTKTLEIQNDEIKGTDQDLMDFLSDDEGANHILAKKMKAIGKRMLITNENTVPAGTARRRIFPSSSRSAE